MSSFGRILAAVAVVAALALPATSPAQQENPEIAAGARVVQTLKAGDAAPIAFSAKIRPAGGPALAKGAKLKRGQTIRVIENSGADVGPPGGCGCMLEGLTPVPGARLVNAAVVAVYRGRTVAVAPVSQLVILGNTGLSYGWPQATKRFKAGTKVLGYALYRAR
jgi:hypothetical protein